MTISQALEHCSEKFKSAGFELPQYESRELLRALTSLSPAELIVKESVLLTPVEDKVLLEWLEKRVSGVPLAYLTGIKGFYKYEFVIEPGVLVPRPETELVVETALRRAKDVKVRAMADLGCGSGCIGLSLLVEYPDATLWAIDVAIKACGVAAKNSEKMQLDERVYVIHKSIEQWQPKFALDLIVANPPYIAEGDPDVQKSVHQHEPHAALYSGLDGLDAIRVWTLKAFGWLNRGGVFVCEVGAGQSAAVMTIMADAGFKDVESARDLAGIERVISARK